MLYSLCEEANQIILLIVKRSVRKSVGRRQEGGIAMMVSWAASLLPAREAAPSELGTTGNKPPGV